MKESLGRKIVVIGPNGSGKTTVAKKLSGKLNIPHIELDSVYWKPDWGESTNEEFRGKVDELTAGDEWIIDGNYARTQDLTASRADTIIWLDYPFAKIMFRVIKRSVTRIIDQKPLWHNNRESLRLAFSKDSIILFAAKTYRGKRLKYEKDIVSGEFKNKNWIRLKNSLDEKRFWDNLNTNHL